MWLCKTRRLLRWEHAYNIHDILYIRYSQVLLSRFSCRVIASNFLLETTCIGITIVSCKPCNAYPRRRITSVLFLVTFAMRREQRVLVHLLMEGNERLHGTSQSHEVCGHSIAAPFASIAFFQFAEGALGSEKTTY